MDNFKKCLEIISNLEKINIEIKELEKQSKNSVGSLSSYYLGFAKCNMLSLKAMSEFGKLKFFIQNLNEKNEKIIKEKMNTLIIKK